MDLGLNGKVALVTGAGQNIGRRIALTLAAEGAAVAVNDLFEDRAEQVAQEIRDGGGRAVAAVADVTKQDQVEAAVATTREALGPVQILVNNAGLPAPTKESESRENRVKEFVSLDPELWARWIDLNYYGALWCTRAVLPGMQEGGWGRIVSIISDAARIGEPRQAVYAGAKAAIAAFSKSIAREVARNGITVNCVSLGAIIHPEWLKEWGTPEEVEERLGKIKRVYPLARAYDRLGKAEDAAFMVTILASQPAEWITGQIVSVNGGFSMVG
jgi:NAD(P)-dependent dehydrogenase (short-subunit alcohol dehydrogenase family)